MIFKEKKYLHPASNTPIPIRATMIPPRSKLVDFGIDVFM